MARKWSSLPNIFLKILGNKQPERDVEATPEVAARVSDQELLQNAMAYAPSHAKFPKAKNAKKATSSKKTIKKKPSQKVVAKGKPKANSSSEALQLQGDDIHGNDTMPEDVNVYTFESSVYGHCKREIYSMKSYIRCKDISAGKWKSALGSCAPNHGAICRKLVPHVMAGKKCSGAVQYQSQPHGRTWLEGPCQFDHTYFQSYHIYSPHKRDRSKLLLDLCTRPWLA